jgi:hypothetical protein
MELVNNTILNGLTDILEKCGERIEGNLICDIYPNNLVINRNINKIRNLQVLSRNKKKICEIGVNACHSLLIMILENQDAEYLLFDLNNHKYTNLCVDYIKSQFPKTKITIIYGDSTLTVSEYINKNKEDLRTYDLCHIDGGHEKNVFEKDYENIKFLSALHSPVIFDDSDMIDINIFLNSKLNNEITRYIEPNIINTNLHLVYSYIS